VGDFAEQHEAEFAAGAKPQGGAHGVAGGRAEAPGEQADDGALDEQQGDQHGEYLPPQADQYLQIELDADGHEEKAHQDIAEGLDVILDLQAVFGFGNQHAGDEGAKRQRQPGQFGQRGEAQGDQQDVEDEHLGRFGAGHEVEPLAHQFLAEDKNDCEHDDGLEERHAEQHREFLRRLGQRGNDDQQRHHRQILQQQHAHDFTAVRRVELHALGQQLGQDGGR